MGRGVRSRLRDIWLALFFLGVVFINFPFLHIFDREEYWLGFPPLFLYIFIGWAISILVIGVCCRALQLDMDEGNE